MLRGIEDALWLPAWASAVEEEGGRLPRHITRATADPLPPEVGKVARQFAAELVRLNRGTLVDLVRRAEEADGGEVSPEELGYYLTMQALGHGVGWEDSHEAFNVALPYMEAWVTSDGKRWHLETSMSRGQRSRAIGTRMRRR